MAIWDLPGWAAWLKAIIEAQHHLAASHPICGEARGSAKAISPHKALFPRRVGEYIMLVVASGFACSQSLAEWELQEGWGPVLGISTRLFLKPTTSSLRAPFTVPLGCYEVGKRLLEILLDSVNSSVPPASHMVRLSEG